MLTFLHLTMKDRSTPVEESDDDEAEIVLLRIDKTPDGDVYSPIENDILQNEVFEEFLDLMDEIEVESE